jgi:ABC-type transport system involved in multi-copper enzyme maturation permease subunit
MRNIGIIFRREFRSYFDSPIAYIFLIVYLLLNNGLYMSGFFLAGIADMRGFFGNLPLFNAFFLPAVAMRLWAEDKKSGTMELLMTLPMRSREVVMGKYLAALAFYGITLLGTVTLPITLQLLGNPDVGAVFAGYLGAVLLGAFFLAIGIFVSGLFKDQIAAFLVGSLLCLFFFLVGQDWVAAPIDGWISGLGSFLQTHVGMWTHFEAIQRGVIDAKNLLYFIVLTGLFLVLNTLSLEGRRY